MFQHWGNELPPVKVSDDLNFSFEMFGWFLGGRFVLFFFFLFAFYFYFEMRGVTMAWNPWYPLVTPVSGSNVGRGRSGTASN
jgi:hypothetical protein